jgi:hypothetical protein
LNGTDVNKENKKIIDYWNKFMHEVFGTEVCIDVCSMKSEIMKALQWKLIF